MGRLFNVCSGTLLLGLQVLFPWWWMRMSTFSCSTGQSGYPRLWSACLNHLPIFHRICLKCIICGCLFLSSTIACWFIFIVSSWLPKFYYLVLTLPEHINHNYVKVRVWNLSICKSLWVCFCCLFVSWFWLRSCAFFTNKTSEARCV